MKRYIIKAFGWACMFAAVICGIAVVGSVGAME